MRRRVQQVAVLAALMAVVVFGVPLAFAVRQMVLDGVRRDVAARAEHAAAAVSPDALRGRDPLELGTPPPGGQVGVYATDGHRLAGTGPARPDAVTARALRGVDQSGTEDGWIVVAVPVRQGETVVAVARAAAPVATALGRVRWAWAAMAVLAVLAVGFAAVVARHRAGRLAGPLAELADTARVLGHGDLTARGPRCGVPEIDVVATALDDTAARLGSLLARERAFSAHASHQLRTPLTGLRLLLETGSAGDERALRRAAADALDMTDRLEQTIDELLALARVGSSSSALLDVGSLLDDLHADRVGALGAAGRALRVVRDDDLPAVRVSAGAVRQILGVLVDNATVHGRGTVTVRARDAGDALALDVEDEGPGIRAGDDPFRGAGLGLSLARTLAESEGGRLVLSRPGRGPRFTLVLPASPAGSSGGRAVPGSLP